MSKILLIDDDEKLGDLLQSFFGRFDLNLIAAQDPETGLQKLVAESPDLVILDVMLPGQDGFEVCRTIRKTSAVPIIMLTARGEVTDRIVGLEIGADDYMPKPFEPRELVARIQNVLRRSQTGDAKPKGSKLEYEGLTVDLDKRSAELDGEPLDLTTMEYQLLALFAGNPGQTYTRDEILNELRGIDAQLFSRSVDILISRLRQKLGDTSKQSRFIKTVWGTGYVFVGEEPAA
ncbi:MAG: response regulator transcription factor [Gammaproteobacteria bacterium]|nr:response regulator transcription factor [Gammaproteobacteria bacterium]NND55111.1 response regulator transcription factor [Gammaproteobacteria bacterium]